ncbi:MAG TPA: hypothetical protein VF875_13765 [Anaeromyxobacter sp.]
MTASLRKWIPVAAALLGLAGPALAAESHAAKHDPQTATTTTKGHTSKAPATQEKAPVKGRHAKASKSKKGAAKTVQSKPASPAAQPAAK